MCQEAAQLIDYRGGMGLITILLFGGRPWKSTEVSEKGSQTCGYISVAKMHTRDGHPLWVPISCSPIWDRKMSPRSGTRLTETRRTKVFEFSTRAHHPTDKWCLEARRRPKKPQDRRNARRPQEAPRGGARKPRRQIGPRKPQRGARRPQRSPRSPKRPQETPRQLQETPESFKRPQEAPTNAKNPQELL